MSKLVVFVKRFQLYLIILINNKLWILAMWRLMGWINGGVLDGIPKEILDPYKQVNGNFKAMEENPQIRAYMKEKYNK